jgi:hypothetical protein
MFPKDVLWMQWLRGNAGGSADDKIPQGYGRQGSNIVNVHCNHVARGFEPTNSFIEALEASQKPPEAFFFVKNNWWWAPNFEKMRQQGFSLVL